ADLMRERSRLYARANASRRAENQRTREARKRGQDHGCVTLDRIESLVAAAGGACVYCGGDYESLDHVYPITLGGPHCVENLAPACISCNSSKRDRVLADPPPAFARCALSIT